MVLPLQPSFTFEKVMLLLYCIWLFKTFVSQDNQLTFKVSCYRVKNWKWMVCQSVFVIEFRPKRRGVAWETAVSDVWLSIVICRWGTMSINSECCLCYHIWSSCLVSWYNSPHIRGKLLLCASILVLWDCHLGACYSVWRDCLLPEKESSCNPWWRGIW